MAAHSDKLSGRIALLCRKALISGAGGSMIGSSLKCKRMHCRFCSWPLQLLIVFVILGYRNEYDVPR
jgi:hypothetical protein